MSLFAYRQVFYLTTSRAPEGPAQALERRRQFVTEADKYKLQTAFWNGGS